MFITTRDLSARSGVLFENIHKPTIAKEGSFAWLDPFIVSSYLAMWQCKRVRRASMSNITSLSSASRVSKGLCSCRVKQPGSGVLLMLHPMHVVWNRKGRLQSTGNDCIMIENVYGKHA